jgi:hypothetical protein
MSKNKIVIVRPNYYANAGVKIKLKQALPKTNSAGFAIKDINGKIATTDETPQDTVQIPGTSRTIAARLTPSGMKTGLEKIIDNPYKDLDVYHPQWGERLLKGKDKTTIQRMLEYKHNKDVDYYSGNYIDNIIASDKLHEQPFFLKPESKFTLDGNVVYLNLNNPLDEVRYYMLLAHPIVANSEEDLLGGKNNKAKYYISDSKSSKNAKIDKIMRQNKAAAALEELNKKESSTIIAMALCMEIEDRNPSKEKAYAYIYNRYNRSEEDYAIFIKFFDFYKDKNRREMFFGHALVQEMLNHGVLRTRDRKLFWIKPETENSPLRTFEWSSRDSLVNEFINAPEYAEEFKIMKSILDSKK